MSGMRMRFFLFLGIHRKLWRLKCQTAVILLCLFVAVVLLRNNFLPTDSQAYMYHQPDQLKLKQVLSMVDSTTPTAQLVWKLRHFRVKQVNCMSIIGGDRSQLQKGLELSHREPWRITMLSDYDFSKATCNDHRSRLVTSTLSDDERQFPLAFSIMAYKDFGQLLRLLRAIYRPEHAYCLHVDSKANWWFRHAATTFANCLDNVVIAESIDVRWSRYSVLEAELACWRLLLQSKRTQWLYLINLTGQEYPLRTMRELTTILKQLRGSNSIENAGPVTSYKPHRLEASMTPARNFNSSGSNSLVWHKGSVHVVVTRGFVQFVFSPVGLALQADLRQQDAYEQREPPTDEVLFATLNYNSGVLKVPGAPVDATSASSLPFLPRYKNWKTSALTSTYPCLSGRFVRFICIWGLADLPAMNSRFELFANKFHGDFQPLAQQCMEERFWHNTLADYGLLGVNKTWTVEAKFYSKFSLLPKHG